MLIQYPIRALILLFFINIVVYRAGFVLANENVDLDNDYISRKNANCFGRICSKLYECYEIFSKKKNHKVESIEVITPLLHHDNFIDDTSFEKKEYLRYLNNDLILLLSSYLNCFDIINLSHVSKAFRHLFDQSYWQIQIKKEKYIIWDNLSPPLKVYLANYYYCKGFGIHSSLPEPETIERNNIIVPANMPLVKKALKLGFPKGQAIYDQALKLLEKKKRQTFQQNHENNFRFISPQRRFGIRGSSRLWGRSHYGNFR